MRRAPVDILHELLGEQGVGSQFALPEHTAHYLCDVLRLEAGEVVELFDGAGLVVHARLITLRPAAHVEVEHIAHIAPHARAIILCQAIPKGERWEWILEKSTELGVSAIYPVTSARTIVKVPAAKQAKKLTRWTQIMESAARQSGRVHTPSIHAPASIIQTLDACHEATHIVAALHRDTRRINELLAGVPEVGTLCLWAGPEGGWTPDELETLAQRGAHFTSLGPRVLRAETAALSLLTLTQHLAGDWS
jgi:16S rRNA (uracil1498-N3)-methyltransferase